VDRDTNDYSGMVKFGRATEISLQPVIIGAVNSTICRKGSPGLAPPATGSG